MKKTLLLAALLCIACTLFSEEAKLYGIIPQGMLIDEKNPVRYSVYNVTDGDGSTVYAIEQSRVNAKKPLLRILFTDSVQLDGITIKGGYFNSTYYSQNNRLKTVTVQPKLNGKNAGTAVTVTLKDEMKEQTIALGFTATVSAVEITVKDVYPGAKWNDTVISDISFVKGGVAYKNVFSGSGAYAYADEYHSVEYDANGFVLSDYVAHGHSGGGTTYYLKDAKGRLAFDFTEYMDTYFYSVYNFKSDSDKHPYEKATYTQDGTLKEKTTLEYKNARLVKEQGTFGTFNTKTFTYDGAKLISSTDDSKGLQSNVEYWYQGDTCIAQKAGSSLYQNIYDKSGKIMFRICVLNHADMSDLGPRTFSHKERHTGSGTIVGETVPYYCGSD